MEITKTVTIINKLGLHARAATKLVQVANQYTSDIELRKDDEVAPANSVLALLMLGSSMGKQVTIYCKGEDAEQAMQEIENLIANKFDEEE